jgi:NADH-quinone oxidoreductase subunit M
VMLPFFTFLFFLLLLLCPISLRYHQEATMIFALEIGVIALFLAQDIFLYFLAFTLLAFPLFFELRNQGATAREIRFFLLFQTSKLVLFALAFLSLYLDFSPQGREAFFSLPALLAQIPQQKIGFFTTLLFSLALLAQLGVFPFHLPTILVFQKSRYSGVIAYFFGHLLVTSMLTLGSNFLLTIFRPFFDLLLFLLLLNAIYFAVLSLTQQVLRRLVAYQYLSFLSAGMTLFLSPTKAHLLHGTIELVMLSLVFGGMLCALWLAEYRLNISNITQYQGAAHRLPSLAAFFFLLVLTAIGFPGTIGYIAEELLLQNRFNHARIQGFASLLVIAGQSHQLSNKNKSFKR